MSSWDAQVQQWSDLPTARKAGKGCCIRFQFQGGEAGPTGCATMGAVGAARQVWPPGMMGSRARHGKALSCKGRWEETEGGEMGGQLYLEPRAGREIER